MKIDEQCNFNLGSICYSFWALRSKYCFVSQNYYTDRDDSPNTEDHIDAPLMARGANPSQAAAFRIAQNTSSFSCFDGSKIIPWSAVNDDYCDCPEDGSDEPGTAACQRGHFFCPHEVVPEASVLPSYNVNDNFCDCCDGADEWAIGSVQCPNTCSERQQAYQEMQKTFSIGRSLRAEYASQGKHARESLEGALQAPWGQDDAFFPLHNKCFLERFGEYDYNLCFFKSVDQLSVKSKTERNALGTTWTWNATMRAGVFSEGKQCHAGPKRSTAVVFECGTEDKLVAVAEKQKCVYEARFLTPAACWT
eukprot:m.283520 g.283520  ORF g.283520 m.283520 type:complete len:307 (-) comp19880_c0_seq10:262-1182(-)